MIHLVLNHTMPKGEVCPLNDLSLKFSSDDYRLEQKGQRSVLTPVWDIARPKSWGKFLLIQQVVFIKHKDCITLELIPNNLYIVLSYLIVMLMGYREALNDPNLSGGDVLIISFTLFSIFLGINFSYLKRHFLKEVSREIRRIPNY